jgi:hypothetical protein
MRTSDIASTIRAVEAKRQFPGGSWDMDAAALRFTFLSAGLWGISMDALFPLHLIDYKRLDGSTTGSSPILAQW